MADAAWLHTLDPFAIRFTHTFGVRWYGLAYLAGFLCGWWLLRAMARRRWILLTPEQVGDAILALVLGVFLGGRIGYAVFYQPSLFVTFTSSPPWWGMLAINQGGMASHGGMIGVILACVWSARRSGVPTLHLLDAVSLAAPIGLFFGRLANFVNGELLGRIVAMPGEPAPWWAVRFPQELLTGHRPALTDDQQARLLALLDQVAPGWDQPGGAGATAALERLIEAVQRGTPGLTERLAPLLAARHPSQLYQALAEGPVLLAALWLIWRRPRRPGVVGAWFLMIYGALRIVTELWRLPDDTLAVPRVMGLSRGQWLSAAMILSGAVALWVVTRRRGAAPLGGWGKATDRAAGVSSEPR
ncbi:MAG: prolipoprotein diacylglyceryl transferase [Planctomycetota bacterium]|nr:MAG: prolipoprotein diacylglyceryl transferase [Planctomycetota bacterium]